MALTADALDVHAAFQFELDQMVDSALRDLAEAWERAWAEVEDEFRDAIADLQSLDPDTGWPSRAAVLRAERAQKALQITSDRIWELSQVAGARIVADLQSLADAASAAELAIIAAQLPGAAVGGMRLSTAAIEAIVRRTTQQITARLYYLSDDATAAMRSALIRGVNTGASPRKAAADMLRRTQTAFNGGRYRAENIARTEMLDAYREASRQSRVANAEVLDGWEWVAEFSSRTCPACLSMHGRRFPPDEPGPLGHPSCRCTAAPVTKSWAELGLGDGLPEPVPALSDAQKWFNSQSRADQEHIMGKNRLAAYRRGDVSWSQMSVTRTNPEWRNYVTTPPLK